MTLGEAARRALLVRTAEAALQVERARRREDPAGVHDLRVAVRRLRSVMDGFRAALGGKEKARALDARLRDLMSAAGAVRDKDVVAQRLGRAGRGAPARARAQIAEIARRSQAGRARAEQSLDRALHAFVFEDLPVLGAAVADASGRAPADEAVGARLRKRASRMAALARAAQARTPAEMHALRIAVKKVRDLVEASLGLIPGAAPRLPLLRARATQLGDLHDLDVWIARLAPLRADPAVRGGATFLHARAWKQRGALAARLGRSIAHGEYDALDRAISAATR